MSEEPKPTWLDDPDAPASEEEKIASARLRDALDDPKLPHADADLARALALADAPSNLAEDEHRQIVERAVAKSTPRGRVIRAAFGVTAALAVAAAGVLMIGRARTDAANLASAPTAAAEVAVMVPARADGLARARSTQPLFDAPFAKPLSRGAASARIDRIAMARASDLRDNRFAMWGVR